MRECNIYLSNRFDWKSHPIGDILHSRRVTMLTETKARAPRKPRKKALCGPVVLKSREEASRYIAKHAKPVGRSPKGRRIYKYEDLKKLDIQYPDQKEWFISPDMPKPFTKPTMVFRSPGSKRQLT
jgi:hypothetical protein